MSLTPDDLNALTERFATKADLDRFATKADLANHPTKADLANHPTKADLAEELRLIRSEMATRSEMRMLFEDLKSTMKLLFDGVAARVDALEERTFGTLPNHEQRIGRLELQVSALRTRRRKR